jgi:hypothetical protein
MYPVLGAANTGIGASDVAAIRALYPPAVTPAATTPAATTTASTAPVATGGGSPAINPTTIAADGSNPRMQIALLYRAALGRLPDAPGLAAWTSYLTGGVENLQQIAQNFAQSQEFTERFGALDNAGFVTQMYQNVLGRPPDAAGFAAWTGQMAANPAVFTRGFVLAGFGESQESLQTYGPGIIASGLITG